MNGCCRSTSVKIGWKCSFIYLIDSREEMKRDICMCVCVCVWVRAVERELHVLRWKCLYYSSLCKKKKKKKARPFISECFLSYNVSELLTSAFSDIYDLFYLHVSITRTNVTQQLFFFFFFF
ncbi:hypothetical protein BDF20DRAFT_459428 [Mycotypha africana]|uniref:uncharacterized protein n=1 Tax=Mycotypha africana TaxID=64632 RepID=UPI0023008583|nr:uncharacterized protein BDF20DRAFT_459428 [Mycotypha africana]KAI8982251.1 hypothetical protein BDF20DRAFT_459428 [Mycotypha africana]